MKRVLTVAAAAALLMAGLPALAGSPEERDNERGARLLERLDRDGDGAVTEAELIAAADERVARRVGKMFARMDRNGDGRLERAQLDAAGDARFERMDADGDGRIAAGEVRGRWPAGRHGKGGVRSGN